MAYDDRHSGGRWRERGRWRDDERETQWRGDPAFGAGWGNQVPRPQRLGDRSWRPYDDPYAESERYGAGPVFGYGGGGDLGPTSGDSDLRYGGPGYDAGFPGPRFDRADVGSVGSHGVHPISSAFGASYGAPYGAFGSAARAYAIAARDPHYLEWRHRQIAALDHDYDEYRRETQARFDREFGAWRERRGVQRAAVGKVANHMEVIGSDGSHVGTVDYVRGDDLILTRSDASAGGLHHRIPCGWIDSVDDKVKLNLTAEEATNLWREEHRSRALFEREDSGSAGPHILNRSFSGTYSDRE